MLVGNIKGESRFAEEIILFLQDFDKSRPIQSAYEYLKKRHNKFAKWEYNRVIKRLKHSNRIAIVEKNGKQFLELTKKGKITALLSKLGPQSQAKDWDGKWRLMIWDIPESSSSQRNMIRWFVKRLGFFKLQQSVYITPYELSGEAVSYLVESDLWKFIRFLRVDRLDDDRIIRKHFKL